MFKIHVYITALLLLQLNICVAQHNNEFYNNGSVVNVQAGAELHVLGDVHMYGGGSLTNNGLIQTHGNSYSDNIFQQRGTGTYRIQNSMVNIGERQFISGSYAVRGGQPQIGVNDGSFYNLELANDQGIVYLVGFLNVADVRNAVDFNVSSIVNRIITYNVGNTGAITYPVNGSSYTSIFGIMNPTAGMGCLLDNTVITNGNMSSVDNAYVQGKLRRAINPSGGLYNFVLGLEPAGITAKRGVQYVTLNFAANDYDVISGYFESGSPNSSAVTVDCSGSAINYWGGADHGEWVFQDINGGGTGTYEIRVWPQDHTLTSATVWVVTKDDLLLGTVDQCSPSTVGLARGGLSGFSEFGVAAPIIILPVTFVDLKANGMDNFISVNWEVTSENNLNHYEVERSEDGINFSYLSNVPVQGALNQKKTYTYNDYDVKYFQNYYYKIKNVDNGGTFNHSPIAMANLESKNLGGFTESSIMLFPNPSSDDFILSFFSDQVFAIDMQIFNALGQLILSEELSIGIGKTNISIQSEYWKPGIYNIRLTDSFTNKTIFKRFIKN